MTSGTLWMRSFVTGALVGAALVGVATVWAQEVRDPTRAPPGATPVEPGATPAPPPAAPEPLYSPMVMRNGKPYLVCGQRLCGVGQKMGSDTIERITESEVWLRNGKQVQKLQRYEGVQRRPVQP